MLPPKRGGPGTQFLGTLLAGVACAFWPFGMQTPQPASTLPAHILQRGARSPRIHRSSEGADVLRELQVELEHAHAMVELLRTRQALITIAQARERNTAPPSHGAQIDADLVLVPASHARERGSSARARAARLGTICG
jgi:hypothetical protein